MEKSDFKHSFSDVQTAFSIIFKDERSSLVGLIGPVSVYFHSLAETRSMYWQTA